MKIQTFQRFFTEKYFYQFLLFIVLLIAVFFRFYNTPARYGFDFDPTRDALITLYGSKHFLFTQIGPPSGLGPFNFGPWYYYQLILFSIIFPTQYAPWIFIGITSVLCILFMYKIGVLLKGRELGLILAILMAFTPAETGQIRALSNPSLIPFYAVLTIWIFLLLVKKNFSFWWSFIWGVVLGIGINIHYEMIPMMIFPLLLFIFSRYERLQRFLAFTVGMLIAFLPLIAFNMSHHWQTLAGVHFYLTKGTNYVPYRWLFYVKDFWPSFWSYVLGVPLLAGIILAIYTISTLLYFILKKKITKAEALLLAGFVGIFISLRYLLAQHDYYYVIFLHPILLSLFGITLLRLFSIKYVKVFAFFILTMILFSMTLMDIQRMANGEDLLLFKRQAEKLIALYPSKRFALYGCLTEHEKNRVQGIAYFLEEAGRYDENGHKIGFYYKDCVIADQNMNMIPIRNIMDLSRVDTNSLKTSRMKLISPRTVFNAIGLWDKM